MPEKLPDKSQLEKQIASIRRNKSLRKKSRSRMSKLDKYHGQIWAMVTKHSCSLSEISTWVEKHSNPKITASRQTISDFIKKHGIEKGGNL